MSDAYDVICCFLLLFYSLCFVLCNQHQQTTSSTIGHWYFHQMCVCGPCSMLAIFCLSLFCCSQYQLFHHWLLVSSLPMRACARPLLPPLWIRCRILCSSNMLSIVCHDSNVKRLKISIDSKWREEGVYSMQHGLRGQPATVAWFSNIGPRVVLQGMVWQQQYEVRSCMVMDGLGRVARVEQRQRAPV